MKIRLAWFNIYLLLGLTFFAAGCQTPSQKEKKTMSTLRLHMETNQDGTGRSGLVPVTHDRMMVNTEREPFLTEGDVVNAKVVETIGGFAIEIYFDAHGTMVLDMVTTSNKGKRMAILTQFPKSRWIAAPIITRRIANGVLTFTPDASREEAERIVRGLNNVVAKSARANRFN